MKFLGLKFSFSQILQNSLLRNTLWMLFSNGLKLGVQAAYFIMLARFLGADNYGAFVGITALAGLLRPFATLGTGDLLIKNVSRNSNVFSEYWGNSVLIIVVSGLILTSILLLTSSYIFPPQISILVIFLVGIADLIFTLIIDSAIKAFLAVNKVSITAQLSLLLSLKNLGAICIFLLCFQNHDLITWSFLYCVFTFAAALISFLLVNKNIAAPKLDLSKFKSECQEGFYFAVGLSAETVNHNVDKTMLARFSTLDATGIYGAAYRLIDIAGIPIQSLMGAAYTKFFQKGIAGVSGSINFATRLSGISGLYGIIAGLGIYFLAPVVPYILGNQYVNVVEALRWLAPLPFLMGLQHFAADTLTGAGFQGVRSAVQVTTALFNFLLNLWLIPLYSWKGAAWSSLASDGLKMLILWSVVFYFYNQEIRNN
ncbi:oligosaccharide flippase family protein [Calothrix rhizosoleniae]|uniref:oligosaccharide flippase family protein n=1 Tax=Calothrix rhizosoleniae TaxID=888997 RepID=UPI000B4A287D|nr:oligosaccharide flippase family protein [Calothrix rhizosoleniae]